MNELKAKLARKLELLDEVLAITDRQTPAIETEDTDALLALISRRQELIDELDEIQTELPDREALMGDQECLGMISEANGVLQRIQANDARNEKAALERMDDMRDQLRKVNEGRKIYGGYESTGVNQIGGIYINQRK